MKTKKSFLLPALIAALNVLSVGQAPAQTLTALGHLPGGGISRASAVSADGSTVVGWSGSQAFRWTADVGMVGIGPGGATGVSADGSVVVGSVNGEAFRWTSDGGMVGLGYLPGKQLSGASGVSGDGSVVVGSSSDDFGFPQAFRWTAASGMVSLDLLPGEAENYAAAVSGDGSVIVGHSGSWIHSNRRAFRWTADSGMVALGSGAAVGVSADGSVVVGTSGGNLLPGRAFRWTAPSGMVRLDNRPSGGSDNSVAFGVSADGSVIVGRWDLSLLGNGYGFVWTADTDMQSPWRGLVADGVDPAADGWTSLYSASAISADGATIVGYGSRNGREEAFVATIPGLLSPNNRPEVSISNPVDGSTYAGPATVVINVDASDSDGTIARVEVYAGEALLISGSSSPLEVSWENVPPGNYSLTAAATDSRGARTISAPVNITVTNAAPAVAISSPARGLTFTSPAEIAITVDASDADGTITQIAVYAGETLIGSDTSAPFAVTWRNPAAGNYSLTAVATNNLGATTTSAAVNISVTAPLVPVAPASLRALGDLPGGAFQSAAFDVSGDGSVVVGYSFIHSGNYQAFRWTAAGGMVALANLPRYTSSEAYATSADGSVVVGAGAWDGGSDAFRWTRSGGMVGLTSDSSGFRYSYADGVSGDGSVVVGSTTNDSGVQAFRWTAGSGMVGLGVLPGGLFQSSAQGVSADGSVIVGTGRSASGTEAFRWTARSGMVGLGDLPGGNFDSGANAVSADGSVVVGHATSASGISGSGTQAFRWTAGSGMVALGDLPGEPFHSYAYGVSGDGSVVVGIGNYSANTGDAFVWTRGGGMQRLWDVLVARGVDPARDGWTDLDRASGISLDGSTIVGTGLRNGNYEGFIAVVPGLAPPNIPTDVSFARWIGEFGLSASDAGADADPDGDGLPNAVEYVLGGNPAQPTVSPRPAVTLTGDAMVFTFPRLDRSEANTTGTVEASLDMKTWSTIFIIGANTAASSLGVHIDENGAAPDTISVTIPRDSGGRCFARLRVMISP